MVASIIIVSIREIIMINLDNFSSFFVANWKLNGDFKFIDQFIQDIQVPDDDNKCTVVCPTAIYLDYISKQERNFYIGAQNISNYQDGSFTGEISSKSLTELNIDFCIVGHSERRQFFHETNEDVNSKSSNLILNEIIPIICIGETLKEKENNNTTQVIERQLKECIPNSSNSTNTILAYEPVWAIGTGLTPSLEQIDITLQYIRGHSKRFNEFKILYGGSVKVNNVKEIISLPNVDGALIGGASLKSEDFTKIISD